MIVRWTSRAIKDLKRTTREDRKRSKTLSTNSRITRVVMFVILLIPIRLAIGCELARGG
jgi:hypothetical protein